MTQVGGDFYDVFEVGDGDWVVVIGDVCGKGVEAAVVTALARYTIRAAAARLSSPSDVLETLNEALLRHGSERFCTVASARLRETSGRWNLTVCSGGHPLPLLDSRSDARPSPSANTARSSACSTRRPFMIARWRCGPAISSCSSPTASPRADVGSDFYGDERLQAAAAGHGSAEAVVDRILDDVLQFQEGVSADDIAIVVLHVPYVA